MARKLPVLIAICMLAFTPMASHALGFGNIKLNSALNQPLNAEIDLLSATVDEVSGLTVKLASREAFVRAGIDRPVFLSNFKFEIKSRADDTFYIKLSSNQPIREPFLNFLLELNWYNGRILREYTVLLDPPGRIIKQPAVVATPEVKAPEAIVRDEPLPEPLPEPVVEEIAPEPAMAVEVEPTLAVEEEPVMADEPEVAMPEPAVEPVMEEVPPVAVVEEEPVIEEAAPLAVEPESMAEAPVAEDSGMSELEKLLSKSPQGSMLSGRDDITEEETALPEPAEPLVEPEMAVVAPAVDVAVQDSDVFVDDGGLFPRIPLSAYGDEVEAYSEAEPMGELDYGITQKGDNLWTIAKKLQRDDSVSIYQIMMALLKSNPDAFIKGNVHRLKVGQVLRVDDQEMLTAMTDAEARDVYRMQTADWDSYQQEIASAAEEQQPIVAEEVEFVEEAPAEGTGELTVAAPAGEELTAGEGVTQDAMGDEMAALQEELRQLRSDAAAMGGQDPALSRHIAEMEAELSSMQRAISIEDSGLAAMQQQLAAQQEAPVTEEAAVLEETPVAEEMPAIEESPMVAEAPVVEETPMAEEALVAPEGEEKFVVMESLAEGEATEDAMPSESQDGDMNNQLVITEEPAQSAPTPVPAPTPVQQQVASGGFMDTVNGVLASTLAVVAGVAATIPGGPLVLYIGVPVILLLIVLMVIVIRRRQSAQSNFQESILTGEPASVTADAAEATDGESSFLSDFAVSGAGAIQAEDSEVDPLTEADVFMAYGRYEAAEERLNEALEQDPSRKELKLKLLEVFNATKNQQAFESTAEEFYASLGEDASTDPMWDKVLTMGKELAPNNPLFTGDVVAPVAAEAAQDDPGVGLSDSQVMDIGLETGVFQTEQFNAVEAEESTDSMADLDFNLDLGEETETAAEPEAASADADAMDFNLDLAEEEQAESMDMPDLDMGTAEEADDEAEPVTAELEMPAADSLDFNLDTAEPETDLATAEPDAADLDAMDFNLDTGEDSEETAETMMPELDIAEEDETAGSLDFNLDLGDDQPATAESTTAPDSADEDGTMVLNMDDALDFDTESSEEEETAVDLNVETATEIMEELADDDATMALNMDESMDFDLAATGEEETATDLAMDMAESSDMGDLDLAAGGDEVGTKLDLARAYIDMGDPEGARSILDEVLDEGNDSQKQEAQQLIQQIA
ncbi:MAG: hypothetical protein OQK73_09955 [Gammaproteobacteria bacterium]|nr:hypothetical protein [Gammaproteobacteria bacterium]